MADLCPRCDESLPHANSTSCKCGWKKRTKTNANQPTSEPRPFRPCAHMECCRDAMIATQTKTGWANLCYEHSIAHHTREAIAWNREHGIVTTADCLRNSRELAGLKKRLQMLPAERENVDALQVPF